MSVRPTKLRSTILAVCAFLIATSCVTQQSELDAAATSKLVADLSTLSSGVFYIEERITIDGQDVVIRDRIAFSLTDGSEVTHQQADYSELTDATFAKTADLVKTECEEAEEDPEPSGGCTWEFLWAYSLSAMGTPTDVWVIGNPQGQSDPPAAILMSARDFSRIQSTWADRLPMFLTDGVSVESYFGGPPPEAIETEEAAMTWGNLLPWPDQAPRAASARDVQFMISEYISILESGKAEYVRGDDYTWTIGLADDVNGPSSSTLRFLRDHNFDATVENRSLEWTIEMTVDPEEIEAPDAYLERTEFLDWLRK